MKVMKFFLEQNRKGIIILTIISLVSAIFSTINVSIFIPIVNLTLNTSNNNIQNILDKFKINGDPFIILIIIFLLSSVLSFLFEVLTKINSQKLTNEIIKSNEKAIFKKLCNLQYSFFTDNKQGDLTYLTTIAPQSLAWIIQSITDMIQAVILTIGYTILLMLLSVEATIILVIIAIIYNYLINKNVVKLIAVSSNNRANIKQKKNVIVNEFLNGIKTIKLYDIEKKWCEKYYKELDDELRNYYKMVVFQRLPDSIINFLAFIVIGVFALIMYISTSSNFTQFLGVFSAFCLTLYRLLPIVKRLNASRLTITQYLPDCKSVYKLLHENEENSKNIGEELKGFKNNIEFKDLDFKYKDSNENVLKKVNFSVNKNEMTALVGQSGSGKSTIVNLIMRLFNIPPDSILIDGKDINDFSIESIIKNIAYVGQDVFMSNDTVINNITFGLTNISKDELIKACKIADAHNFISKLEEGYDTLVGDMGNKISGGQKQRIAIARALLQKKDIIILDEATSALDNISENNIQKSLEDLAKNVSLIVIAHRLSTIQNADKIVVLDKGSVMEIGNHEELINNRSIYYDMYNIQKQKDFNKELEAYV